MVRRFGWVLLAAALLGCHGQRDALRPGDSTARVHNAIDFGLISSAHFVVSRVDGVVVHRKFDRDELVRVAAGERELRVRFYSESVTRAASGREECRLDFLAEAGRDYYLEGAVEGEWWRARLVDRDGGSEIPCLFGDDARRGLVDGGGATYAVSARPASRQAGSPGAAVEAGAVLEADTVAPALSVDPAISGVGSAPTDATAGAAVASAPAGGAAGILAKPKAVSKRGGTGVLANVMSGRGHWGCPANLFRVSAIEFDAIGLGGEERIRLIGVEPGPGDVYPKALEPLVGGCVSIEYEPALAGKIHRDRDGRLLAYLVDEGGVLINAEVIRLGAATVDPRSRCRRLGELLAAQSEARKARRGVWAGG